MMQQLTRRVLRHKRLVAIGWVVLTLVGHGRRRPGLRGARPALQRPRPRGLGDEPGDPARCTATAARALPLVPVVQLAGGHDRRLARASARSCARSRQRAKEAVPGSRVAGFGSTGDRTFVSEDGRTAFVYVFPPRSDDPFGGNVDVQRDLRERAARARRWRAPRCGVTGYDALYDSSGEADEGPGVLLEAVIGGVGALIVLVFVFGSRAGARAAGHGDLLDPRLVPAALRADGDHRGVADRAVPGRADRPRGLDRLRAADRRALARGAREGAGGRRRRGAPRWAPPGRAVVFSGTTVAVGLLALIALPLPFLRSMGYGGLLIPLVATLVGDHAAAGDPRHDRTAARPAPHPPPRPQRRASGSAGPRASCAAAASPPLVAVAILVALLIPATEPPPRQRRPGHDRQGGPRQGGARPRLRDSGIGKGAIAPIETLAPEADAADGGRSARAASRACTARWRPRARTGARTARR